MKKRVRAQLDPDTLRWLRNEAKRLRISQSQVIRNLIIAEQARQKAATGGTVP